MSTDLVGTEWELMAPNSTVIRIVGEHVESEGGWLFVHKRVNGRRALGAKTKRIADDALRAYYARRWNP